MPKEYLYCIPYKQKPMKKNKNGKIYNCNGDSNTSNSNSNSSVSSSESSGQSNNSNRFIRRKKARPSYKQRVLPEDQTECNVCGREFRDNRCLKIHMTKLNHWAKTPTPSSPSLNSSMFRGTSSNSPARPSNSPARPSNSPARQSDSPARPSNSPARQSDSPARQSDSPARQSDSSAQSSRSAMSYEISPAIHLKPSPIVSYREKKNAKRKISNNSPPIVSKRTKINKLPSSSPASSSELSADSKLYRQNKRKMHSSHSPASSRKPKRFR